MRKASVRPALLCRRVRAASVVGGLSAGKKPREEASDCLVILCAPCMPGCRIWLAGKRVGSIGFPRRYLHGGGCKCTKTQIRALPSRYARRTEEFRTGAFTAFRNGFFPGHAGRGPPEVRSGYASPARRKYTERACGFGLPEVRKGRVDSARRKYGAGTLVRPVVSTKRPLRSVPREKR